MDKQAHISINGYIYLSTSGQKQNHMAMEESVFEMLTPEIPDSKLQNKLCSPRNAFEKRTSASTQIAKKNLREAKSRQLTNPSSHKTEIAVCRLSG